MNSIQESKIPLSVVVITLNEEKNIERCLKSASFADECVVLDSGSQDRTQERARNLGARVFQEPWKGFGPQKRRAAELARNDWILSIDADEVVTVQLEEEIRERILNSNSNSSSNSSSNSNSGLSSGSRQGLNPQTAYRLPRRSFYLGRWIRYGGWYPDYQTRLFHRHHSQWDDRIIHEKVEAMHTEKLHAPLGHFVFRDLAHQVATNNHYSTLQARELQAKGKRFSLLKLLFKPGTKFFECYIFKLGFLDGMPGFIIAVGAAYSVFIRWAKIWEATCVKKGAADVSENL